MKIIKIYWQRANLHLVLDGEIKEDVYLKCKNKIKVQDYGVNRFHDLKPYYNKEAREMIEYYHMSQVLNNGGESDLTADYVYNTDSGFDKETMIGFINEQVELINESQKLNFIRWDVLKEKQFLQPTARGSYEAEIEYLKEFIENRFTIFVQIVTNANTETVNEKVQGGWNGGMGGMGGGGWSWPGWGDGGNGGNGGWPGWGDGGNGGFPGWGGNGGNGGWPNTNQ